LTAFNYYSIITRVSCFRLPPKVPKSIAFEVDVNENDLSVTDGESGPKEDSLVKKHPPKRLQRLEEQQSTPKTAEEILAKQRLAEARRLSLLDEKVQKSKQWQAKLSRRRESNATGNDNQSNTSTVSIESNAIEGKPEVITPPNQSSPSEPTEAEVKSPEPAPNDEPITIDTDQKSPTSDAI
jgi:hypothetical protein